MVTGGSSDDTTSFAGTRDMVDNAELSPHGIHMSLQHVNDVLSTWQDIQLAIVYGSAALGQLRPESDIDIAVQAELPLTCARKMQLIADLATATGRSIDLVDLSTVGEPLRGQILRHGRVLRDTHDRLAQLMTRHVYDMEDFVPYLRRLLAERQHAWTA